MRQVNHDELTFNLRYALSRFPATTLLRELASREREKQHRAQSIAADMLADMLARYEVLSSAPLSHPAGDALFETAEQRKERGVDRLSGVAVADDG